VAPAFARKRPDLAGSRKIAFGDDIYRPDDPGDWIQVDSHHSLRDGSANALNIETDRRVDRVLVSRDFIYLGRKRTAEPSLAQVVDNSLDYAVAPTGVSTKTGKTKPKRLDAPVYSASSPTEGGVRRSFRRLSGLIQRRSRKRAKSCRSERSLKGSRAADHHLVALVRSRPRRRARVRSSGLKVGYRVDVGLTQHERVGWLAWVRSEVVDGVGISPDLDDGRHGLVVAGVWLADA
jgi:hypothetical protein